MNTFCEFIVLILIAFILNAIVIFTFEFGFGIDVGTGWAVVIGFIDMVIIMETYDRIKRKKK